MKLIFLDIDGVMNNTHRSTVLKQASYRPEGIDPIAIGLLKRLLIETKARIVICSTWRIAIGKTSEWWNGLFAAYGIDQYRIGDDKLVVGLTPRLNVERGYEVLKFLNEFKENVESYVIFDDDSDYLIDQPLIKVNSQFGLTLSHIEYAKVILEKFEGE